MILGTFSGADYPLNAMPIRDMREVIRSSRTDARNEIKLCESLKINRARYVAESRLSSSICSTKKRKRVVDSYMNRMNTLLSVIIDLKGESEALNDGGALKQSRQGLQKQPQRCERMNRKISYLVTATLAVKAPIAEMFAVVGQQSVLIFSHPREGSPDHFFSFESDLLGTPDPDRFPRGKLLQCKHFYRTCV